MTLVKRWRRLASDTVRTAARAAASLRAYPESLAAPTTRTNFLAHVDTSGSVLEIGPFDCPQLEGPNVAYFDVLDQAGLRQRAVEHHRSPEHCPRVDFVSATGDLAVVDRKFGVVFSSHVIEHQPNLVAHLQALEKIVEPGGQLHFIVPDKRYCFDHFVPESTIADVVDADAIQRKTHSARSILLHRMFTTHNSSIGHWLGRHGKRPQVAAYADAMAAAMKEQDRSAAGEYIDVHAWYFTPVGFLEIVTCLNQIGAIALKPIAIHATGFLEQEFFAVLQGPV